MAHKKGLGSCRNGRDSNAKRLGVKVFAGQTVTGGEIIVRQRGTKFKPGIGVGIGKDDTIYARAAGTVDFKEGRRGRVISVIPAAVEVEAAEARLSRTRPARSFADGRPCGRAVVVNRCRAKTKGARHLQVPRRRRDLLARARAAARRGRPCRRAGCASSGRRR